MQKVLFFFTGEGDRHRLPWVSQTGGCYTLCPALREVHGYMMINLYWFVRIKRIFRLTMDNPSFYSDFRTLAGMGRNSSRLARRRIANVNDDLFEDDDVSDPWGKAKRSKLKRNGYLTYWFSSHPVLFVNSKKGFHNLFNLFQVPIQDSEEGRTEAPDVLPYPWGRYRGVW